MITERNEYNKTMLMKIILHFLYLTTFVLNFKKKLTILFCYVLIFLALLKQLSYAYYCGIH